MIKSGLLQMLLELILDFGSLFGLIRNVCLVLTTDKGKVPSNIYVKAILKVKNVFLVPTLDKGKTM